MPRTYDPIERMWRADYPPLTCATCGAAIERPTFGRPRKYCELHRPARAEYLARWQSEHVEHLRSYRRERVTADD